MGFSHFWQHSVRSERRSPTYQSLEQMGLAKNRTVPAYIEAAPGDLTLEEQQG
jgi:hypothetical protein